MTRLPSRALPLSLLFLAAFAAPAAANFCDDPADDRARQEAQRLESELFSQAPPGESVDFGGDRAYNARLITCNRKRDSNGGEIERGIDDDHVFPTSLEPRTVKGHYSYQGMGIFSKLRYAYQLERDAKGTWIVTVPIEFPLPTSRMTDMIDIPFELAQQLGLDQPGKVCAPGETVFVAGNPRQVERGFISDQMTPAQQSLFIQDLIAAGVVSQGVTVALDLITAGSVADTILYANYDVVFYPGETACRMRRDRTVAGKNVVDHLREYWRSEIQRVWSRPGFEIKPVMLGIDRVTSAERSAWEKDETIWPVRFNLHPHHRPSFKRWVAKWNNMHSGSWGTTVAHELGHYLGLDDEYGEASTAPRDCEQVLADAASRYLMCDADSGRTGAQGVYPWIITRRYAVARELQCKEDRECGGDEYCDTGTLTAGRNQCQGKRSSGQGCTRAAHCLSGLCPDGFCAECLEDRDCLGGEFCDKGTVSLGGNLCAAKKLLGQGCTRAVQCASGQCLGGFCSECGEDEDCDAGEFCDAGTLGVGGNRCKALKPNGEGCTRPDQCQSGRCNLGFCAADNECDEDGDCDKGEFCDKGTISVGRNQCVDKKPLGDACGRDLQCKSGCCKLHDFKVQCRPANKCD